MMTISWSINDEVDASEKENDDHDEKGDDDDGLSLAKAFDNQDLISLNGLIEYDVSDVDADDTDDGDPPHLKETRN